MFTTRMDITGKTYGRLTVLEYSHTNKNKFSVWRCRCSCGAEIFVTGGHLKSGHTQSCGCLKLEKVSQLSKTHGMRGTRIYRIWQTMRARCDYQSMRNFHDYGGRGICVCDDWKNSFEAFYEWAISNGYTDELSIDRIDVNGNYEPSNCKWSTRKEQSNNKRTNIFLTYKGLTKTLKEWSEYTGVNYSTILSRYHSQKSPAEILNGGKYNVI